MLPDRAGGPADAVTLRERVAIAVFVGLILFGYLATEHVVRDRVRRSSADSAVAYWRGLAIGRAVNGANADIAVQRQAWRERRAAARRDSVDIQFGGQVFRVPGPLAQHITRYNRRDGERVNAMLAARDDATVASARLAEHLRADSARAPR